MRLELLVQEPWMLASHAPLVSALVREGAEVTVVAPGPLEAWSHLVPSASATIALPRAPRALEAAGWVPLISAGLMERQPQVLHFVGTDRLARTVAAARMAGVPCVMATMLSEPPGLARAVTKTTGLLARYVPSEPLHGVPDAEQETPAGKAAARVRHAYAWLRDLPWADVDTVFTYGEEEARAWRSAGLPAHQHVVLPSAMGGNLEAWLEEPSEPQIRRQRRQLGGEGRSVGLTWVQHEDRLRLGDETIAKALAHQAEALKRAHVDAVWWVAGMPQELLPAGALAVPTSAEMALVVRAADIVTIPYVDEEPSMSAMAAGTARRVVCALNSRGARFAIKHGRTGTITPDLEALAAVVEHWLSDPMERMAAGSRARAVAVHGLDVDLAITRIVRAYQAVLLGEADEVGIGPGGLERRERPGPRDLLR